MRERLRRIRRFSTVFEIERKRSISTTAGFFLNAEQLLKQPTTQGALESKHAFHQQGTPLDSRTLARLLLACGRSKSLAEGKRLHDHVLRSGFHQDPFLCSHLIHMYLKCGSLEDADAVFRTLPAATSLDISTMTALLVARAARGDWDAVIAQLQEMPTNGIQPDRIMFISLLTACTKQRAVDPARAIIRRFVAGSSLASDPGVTNVTINMFAKCGWLGDAADIFQRIQTSTRDVVSWTVMIGAYAQAGEFSKSISLFQEMQLQGTRPNKVTFVSVLGACESRFSLSQGRLIHLQVLESGLCDHVVVANSLLGMYSRCSSCSDAEDLFRSMPVRDVVSWTSMITAYSQQDCHRALLLYRRMLHEGVMPKPLTFSMVVEACASVGAVRQGREVHEQLRQRGLDDDDVVGVSLVNMYAKCGCLSEARGVFDRLKASSSSRVLWNSMITAYQEKDPAEALRLFRLMQPESVAPDRVTFMTVLNACSRLCDVEQGRMIQERIFACGLAADLYVATALFNTFAKCGSLREAQVVFDGMATRDIISWNNMLTVYVEHQQGREALRLCKQMQLQGMRPNKSTFATLLSACCSCGTEALPHGRQIHSWIAETGLQSDLVMGTALITMFASCGSLDDARIMFDTFCGNELHHRDLILWTSMITAYEQHSDFSKALDLYQQMHARGVEADRVTFVSVLNACAHISDLRQGREIHSRVMRRKLATDPTVANSIIFMYAKCGSFDEAGVIFESLSCKDVALWSCIISAYAQHGHGEEAGWMFRRMLQDGCELNSITFIGILSACSHAGLVEEGWEFFASMADHGIESTPELCGCMVDLLARAGHLHRTEEFIARMPVEVNSVVLTALLAACRIHGDVERGRRVAEKLEALDPGNDAPYVTLFNIELTR